MRKNAAKKHRLLPDPRFKDELLTKFVNNLMYDGKKSIALKIVYDALDIVEKKSEENALEVWKRAIENVTPALEVRSRRVGGATFQIPTEVRAERKTSLAMKWMILYARKRAGKSMHEKLAAEILAASNNEGAAVKKKEDTHKMAEANKAFAHFRI
ncbi:MAG: 30S ribosomal protein S7 [Bacteroidetes bacterium]|nr:30S ribosomal protein S7 [Bacteroidota bacterium]